MSLCGFAFGEQRIDQAVDGEVGIAADRRGEVAVALAGQGVVAVFLGAVDGALQAAEHGVVDGVFFGAAVDRAEELLQFEAAFQAAGLEAEFGDESGEGVQFARVGAGVHAAQEGGAGFEQRVGDGFVGGEHELFDDLMAFGVFDDVRRR